jgi:Sulfotransferase family
MSRRLSSADRTNPTILLRYARYLIRREWHKSTTRLRFFLAYTIRGDLAPRIIFLHVPKTGGISTAVYVLRRIGWPRGGRSIHVTQMPWHTPISDAQIGRANHALFMFGHMPFTVVDRLDSTRRNYVVTFLREPKARIWSLYRHLHTYHERFSMRPDHPAHGVMTRSANLSPEAFFESDDPMIRGAIDNHMVRQLAGHTGVYPVTEAEWPTLLERAKANLERADFVGLQETYEADFRALMQEIKLAQPRRVPHVNRGVERFGPPPESGEHPRVAQAIERLTRWDRALYEFAVALRQRRVG